MIMEFNFTIERERRSHLLRAKVELLSAGRPGNRRGHPDTWTPDEGIEINYITIYLRHVDRERKLKPDLVFEISDTKEFANALETKIYS